MHLALLCPDLTGHLNPMMTLGRVLRRRGHRVSLAGLPESRPKAEAAELEFVALGEAEHKAGVLAAGKEKLGRLHGFAALRFTGEMLRLGAAITLRDAPDALRRAKVDGVLADQVSAGSAVAEALGLPWAVICNALALHQEPAVPPPVTSWPLRKHWLYRIRNRLGNTILNVAAEPVRKEVNGFRIGHGLKPIRPADLDDDGLIQVAQQPGFFDFPRERLPEHFHFTGPWFEPDRDAAIRFPWERLDGRPLVYASLGTLQNRLHAIFAAIAAACANLDVQLVLSLGRPDAALESGIPAPPGAVIVPFAPQLELLRRAAAVITHAGLNTTLESLSHGVPMVAIPMTNDQPGVARRAAWLGAAEIVFPRHATSARIQAALERILREPGFRESARRCRELLEQSPGAEEAAMLVERALASGLRVTCQAVAQCVRHEKWPP
jgi:MGT family glycosyltransferase